jgi:uncharacterized protein YoaH (UPF0181 family)
MISGNDSPGLRVRDYQHPQEAIERIEEFLAEIA